MPDRATRYWECSHAVAHQVLWYPMVLRLCLPAPASASTKTHPGTGCPQFTVSSVSESMPQKNRHGSTQPRSCETSLPCISNINFPPFSHKNYRSPVFCCAPHGFFHSFLCGKLYRMEARAVRLLKPSGAGHGARILFFLLSAPFSYEFLPRCLPYFLPPLFTLFPALCGLWYCFSGTVSKKNAVPSQEVILLCVVTLFRGDTIFQKICRKSSKT